MPISAGVGISREIPTLGSMQAWCCLCWARGQCVHWPGLAPEGHRTWEYFTGGHKVLVGIDPAIPMLKAAPTLIL